MWKLLQMKDDCIFCKLANGLIGDKGTILMSNSSAVLIEDKNPIAPYHVLVISKQHWNNLSELQDEGPLDFIAVLGNMFDLIDQYVTKNGLEEWGYRVVINCGRDAGQTVTHLHIHTLGGAALKNDFGA